MESKSEKTILQYSKRTITPSLHFSNTTIGAKPLILLLPPQIGLDDLRIFLDFLGSTLRNLRPKI